MTKEFAANSPQITIAMPVYNGAKTLARAVNSILNQTYPHWQLLILDDGSTDMTVAIAKTFKDERILLLSDGQHKGITSRLNQAIELATGRYFARMDADDFSYPERIFKQVTFLEAHPCIDLVGTGIRLIDQQGIGIGVRTFPVLHDEIMAKPWLKSISVAHPTWCGKTVWFQQWRYQDILKNEDQDLLLRAHESSRYANLPDILLDYTLINTFRKSLLSRIGSAKVIYRYFIRKRQPIRYIFGLFIVFIKLIPDFFSKKR